MVPQSSNFRPTYLTVEAPAPSSNWKMSERNGREVEQLCNALKDAAGKGGKNSKHTFSCKKTTFKVGDLGNISVDSWRFRDPDYKRDDLPTYARGLFTSINKQNNPEIVIRGYDKFFNVDEVSDTKWRNIENRTIGPYELSVKENGCIIFMSGLEDGTLLVCSKHSTGSRTDMSTSHAETGRQWVERHVSQVGRTSQELAQELRRMNVTAVAELCDDRFEEHVLEYPPESAGLYLHGINFNLSEFATLSGPEVHEFADTWGFKKAEYIMIQELDQVERFLAQCAKTGSWEGRDTEGFVVRCKLKARGRHEYPTDWFFKYKFDEPYLMYRQWREATKAVISGRVPKYKKHKKITDQYLTYARRQLAKNPQLGKEYNQNHGIIAMRDGFLAEIGKKGADIIAQEDGTSEAEDHGGTPSNIVLVPVASIGCGKTTVARALVRLFDFGHVQNDDIQGPKNRARRFALGITNAMATHKCVIADRNNHQGRERKQIFDDVSEVIEDAHFVALHYVHEPKARMLHSIRDVTRERVLDRGDNHQTIHASRKGEAEVVGIMEGFLQRFEGVDRWREPDSRFDEVIDLDVAASSIENLQTVVSHLQRTYPELFSSHTPSVSEMEEAIDWALNSTITSKQDLSFMSRSQTQNRTQPASGGMRKPDRDDLSDQALKSIEYFAISLVSHEIEKALDTVFAEVGEEEARMYRALQSRSRVQSKFHVTLIHRAASRTHAGMWSDYLEQYRRWNGSSEKREQTARDGLGPARVQLERVVWNDRTMAIAVRILPSEPQRSEDGHDIWPCANAVPHVTVGTADSTIKRMESNDMLKRWLDGDESQGDIRERGFASMTIVRGVVNGIRHG